jgi:hypothetical protein
MKCKGKFGTSYETIRDCTRTACVKVDDIPYCWEHAQTYGHIKKVVPLNNRGRDILKKYFELEKNK